MLERRLLLVCSRLKENRYIFVDPQWHHGIHWVAGVSYWSPVRGQFDLLSIFGNFHKTASLGVSNYWHKYDDHFVGFKQDSFILEHYLKDLQYTERTLYARCTLTQQQLIVFYGSPAWWICVLSWSDTEVRVIQSESLTRTIGYSGRILWIRWLLW